MAGSTMAGLRVAVLRDAACHVKKVSAHRDSAARQREPALGQRAGRAGRKPAEKAAAPASRRYGLAPCSRQGGHLQDRQWRRWAANALMAQPQRNQRVLAALVLAGDMRAVVRDRYAEVAAKVTGAATSTRRQAGLQLREAIEQTCSFDDRRPRRWSVRWPQQRPAESTTTGWKGSWNYLEVDEEEVRARWQLPGPADRQRTGVRWPDEVRAETGHGRRLCEEGQGRQAADFIKALLAVTAFAYAGAVPVDALPEAGLRQDGSTGSGAGAAPAPAASRSLYRSRGCERMTG